MKKFSVPFLYLIFFILSFFNWFNNFLNDKKTFLFVFFLACALAIMIVETILFRKFTFKKFLSLIFFILFILVFRILIRIVSAIPGSFRSILFCSAGTEESHQSEYGQVYILMSHDIVFLPTWILS